MTITDRLLAWMERRKVAARAVPEDPRVRETKLINWAIWCGFAVGSMLWFLTSRDFGGVLVWTCIAIYAGYRVTKLSNFGYRFRGKSSILAKPPEDATQSSTK